MKHDVLIVGAGLYGATCAYELTKLGKKVLVIDKRPHIGGNAYTEKIEGINVHKYGPHIFHTSNKAIWQYIQQFSDFNHYTHRVKAYSEGKIYSLPFNLMTFYQLWGVTTPKEARKRLQVENVGDANLEDWCLSQVGREVYEKFIRGYTTKQWQRHPSCLPASIIRRIPLRFTYDDNYFNDPYQGIPIGGYTQIFEKMLDGVDVRLGVDFKTIDWKDYAKRLIYTGAIDEFFDYEHGRLDYRTLEFEEQILDGDFQGVAQMNYTDESIPWTRIIEHKHFEFGNQPKTVITKEYPVQWELGRVPYYPVVDDANRHRYNSYKKTSEGTGILFGGRLGLFKYLDMDQTLGAALVQVKTWA